MGTGIIPVVVVLEVKVTKYTTAGLGYLRIPFTLSTDVIGDIDIKILI